MKRQRANADNNTLGRSIYQNNLRLQANIVKMGPAFKMHQRYDKNAERKTHARERRWISSSESLSLGRGFWDSNEGLDTENPGCRLQTWPGSHPLHDQMKKIHDGMVNSVLFLDSSGYSSCFRVIKLFLCVLKQ